MNAAIKDADTSPNNPEGSNDNIAGYAISCPSLSLGKAGNVDLRSDNSGKIINDPKAIIIHGHGRIA